MAKQRINPIVATSPVIDKANFKTGNLLPNEEVNAALTKLTTPQPVTPPASKNKAKKETAKGTVVFSAMIEKELMKRLRIEAANTEGSMSDVINEALRVYFKI